MKNKLYLTLLLLFLLIPFKSFSQSGDYPKYYDNNGVKVVMFTVEQAQKIDTELELKSIYEKMISNDKDIKSFQIKIINSKNEEIQTLNVLVDSLTNTIVDKDKIIFNLKQININNENKLKTSDSIINLNEKIINIKDDKIKKLKKDKIIISTSSVIVIILLLLI